MDKTDEIKLTQYDSKGNKTDYNVIMIYDSDVTQKRYIFYTDGSKVKEKITGIRVGILNENDGKVSIKQITNPVEQQMLSEIFEEYTKKEDNASEQQVIK